MQIPEQLVTEILIDLQHPNLTSELVNEIVTRFSVEIDQTLNDPNEFTVYLYESIIHFCPELR